ncbi:hypothetical protein [Plantactinospora sp. GCM10030261]|uniref:hypothetical protein n=1 Tax=Plantactinospora sp. GCM10030261 TaxID=3273420 RepID=UPI003619E40B
MRDEENLDPVGQLADLNPAEVGLAHVIVLDWYDGPVEGFARLRGVDGCEDPADGPVRVPSPIRSHRPGDRADEVIASLAAHASTGAVYVQSDDLRIVTATWPAVNS